MSLPSVALRPTRVILASKLCHKQVAPPGGGVFVRGGVCQYVVQIVCTSIIIVSLAFLGQIPIPFSVLSHINIAQSYAILGRIDIPTQHVFDIIILPQCFLFLGEASLPGVGDGDAIKAHPSRHQRTERDPGQSREVARRKVEVSRRSSPSSHTR